MITFSDINSCKFARKYSIVKMINLIQTKLLKKKSHIDTVFKASIFV